jgi:hypothetical protein
MSAPPHLSGPARWAVLPRRTVRLRLTALYGALFLASGAGLLTIINILARSWPWAAPPTVTAAGSNQVVLEPGQVIPGRISPVSQPAPFQAEWLARLTA